MVFTLRFCVIEVWGDPKWGVYSLNGGRGTGLDIKAKKRAGLVDLFSLGDLPHGPETSLAT